MTGFTDFLTDPVGALPEDMTLLTLDGGGHVDTVATVEELEGSLSGQALKLNNANAAWRGVIYLDEVAPFASGDMTMLLRIPGWSGSEVSRVGPSARMGPDDPPADPFDNVNGHLAMRINTVYVYHSSGSSTTPFGNFVVSEATGLTMTPGDRWWIRFNFRPELYHVKAWLAAAEEPVSWQIDSNTSAAPTEAAGYAGLAFNLLDGANVTWIEALGWSDNPTVPAPLARAIDWNPRGRAPEGRRRSLVTA